MTRRVGVVVLERKMHIPATAWPDPLVAVFALLVLGGLASYFLFKRRPLARSIVRVVFLILLTIAFARAGIVPYQPLQLTGTPLLDAVHGTLKVAWWLWAAWFLVELLRAFVVVERQPHKLLHDLLAGLIYLGAAFAIIAYVFDLPIQGLLATSGAVAIVLGLAFQSTLSDVFSGIILSFSRPYLPGDWISLEGGTEGRVIEMNWRATHVLTGHRDLAIVPNSSIAKSRIINLSSPSGMHGVTVTVQLDAKTSPSTGSEILEIAALNCGLIVRAPRPTVSIKSITGICIEFDITFFVEELASSAKARNELFDLIFRHLAAAGLQLASSQSDQDERDTAKTKTERILDLVPIFASLTTDERKSIAAKLKCGSYDEGEMLVKPGTVVHSLSIIGAGILSRTREETDGEIELDRLGPGDHYGEIGMLTGVPSNAKITALIPSTVYELAREDLAPILEARPEVAQELSRALAQRQAAGRSTASAELGESVPMSGLTRWFAERLRRLQHVWRGAIPGGRVS
jgi:small-conductance mechanosensitive channel/CRP-like cAMP-binding protein